MAKRGKPKIFVLESEYERVLNNAFVACEIIADLRESDETYENDADVMYAVVATNTKWFFIKSYPRRVMVDYYTFANGTREGPDERRHRVCGREVARARIDNE
jgi:hypothetical protein